MRVTAPAARRRTALVIELFKEQGARGFPDELIADAFQVSVATVDTWRNGVMPKHSPGNLRAGLDLLLDEWARRQREARIHHRRISMIRSGV